MDDKQTASCANIEASDFGYQHVYRRKRFEKDLLSFDMRTEKREFLTPQPSPKRQLMWQSPTKNIYKTACRSEDLNLRYVNKKEIYGQPDVSLGIISVDGSVLRESMRKKQDMEPKFSCCDTFLFLFGCKKI